MSEKENFFSTQSYDVSWLSYNAAEREAQIAKQNEEKFENIKERLLKFENITKLEDARALASQILPTALEVSSFKIGTATCTVVNKPDMVRISLDSDKEFICYDFV